jgi:hypothetical protein
MKVVLGVVLALAVVAAACGGQVQTAQPPTPAPVSAGQVYIAAGPEQALRVVDASTGTVARTLPAGTPSPDWRWLYRLGAGALDVLDPVSGRVVATHPAPDWARVVRTSADGRWLVLAGTDPGDRFQVQDAAWTGPPVSVVLPRTATFDGISVDGRRLYLLERLAAGHYQVRMYDLRRGALAPYVIADKREVGQPMSGTALASFTTHGGGMQLTLYQRSAKGEAFVHALPIGQEAQWAFCVDLPGPPDGWAFAPAPDGQRFYAVNAVAGRVVELRTNADGPPVVRQRQVASLGGGQPAVAVGADGATVYVGTDAGVAAVDAGKLELRGRGPAGLAVTALAASPDGRDLYAVSGATRLVRLDPHTLRMAGEVRLSGPLGAIVRVT